MCAYSGGISCICRQGSMDLVDLCYSCLGIMHGVMDPVLQYYYKQCYLSYKISDAIILNVLL